MQIAKQVSFGGGCVLNVHASALQLRAEVYLVSVRLKCPAPKKCMYLARRAKHACMSTRPSHQMCVSSVAHQTCIPLQPKCHQKCFWILGVFERLNDKMCAMRNATHCVFAVWGAERAELCTKNANKDVSGIPSICLFEIPISTNCFCSMWRAKHAYLCTITAVFQM